MWESIYYCTIWLILYVQATDPQSLNSNGSVFMTSAQFNATFSGERQPHICCLWLGWLTWQPSQWSFARFIIRSPMHLASACSFPHSTFGCSPLVVYPGRKGRRRYRIKWTKQWTKSPESDALADSLLIGLDDEVSGSSMPLLACCRL